MTTSSPCSSTAACQGTTWIATSWSTCLTAFLTHLVLATKTPFKQLYNKETDLSMVPVIGARAFVHIEGPTKNLADKAVGGVLRLQHEHPLLPRLQLEGSYQTSGDLLNGIRDYTVRVNSSDLIFSDPESRFMRIGEIVSAFFMCSQRRGV